MVTPLSNLFSSSSFLIASCKCRGIILDFLLSHGIKNCAVAPAIETCKIITIHDLSDNGGHLFNGKLKF